MTNTVTNSQLGAFSFMGLLASEGKVPGTTAAPASTPVFSVIAEDLVREVASDLTAKGDFFSLMVETGQMRAQEPAKKYNIKIVRPTSLGGGFGGTFGGGALAH